MDNLEQNNTSQFESYIGQVVKIKIDRALGTPHPKHGFIYDVNYGFVPGVIAPDGEDLDAYLLGVDGPVEEFEGKCVAIVHRLNDDDDKLVIIPKDQADVSDDEIRRLTNFQEQYFKSIIIRKN